MAIILLLVYRRDKIGYRVLNYFYSLNLKSYEMETNYLSYLMSFSVFLADNFYFLIIYVYILYHKFLRKTSYF